MFEKFGEFDSAEELNRSAAGLLAEGDMDSLKELAAENGISEYDVEDYADGVVEELATALMAALGKLAVEEKNLKPYGIMEDWIAYIRVQCQEDAQMAVAVRKRGKNVKHCIAELLKWSFQNKKPVDEEIMKAAGISQRCEFGIPGMGQAKKIIQKYYKK